VDFDWTRVAQELDAEGWARLEGLLPVESCDAIAGLYDTAEDEASSDRLFRSRVVMGNHGYGSGEYRYFAYPLPPLVAQLRADLYRPLAPIANRWSEAMATGVGYPSEHVELLARCRAAGQTAPTPLLLRYGAGDYNRLHQDLYGEHFFPLQVAILLSQPGRDFEGGELVLTEQRARMQSRAMVVPLVQGDGVVFAVSERPALGPRGIHRVKMRHGVSRLRSGRRHTLGIIFHDAR
jgi:hypothetical protein